MKYMENIKDFEWIKQNKDTLYSKIVLSNIMDLIFKKITFSIRMKERLSEDIIDLFNKKSFLDDWLNFKYKEKSLVIYGSPGSGKSTIADYILKDWVKVYIKSDFCKSSKNFDDYLNDTLYKKSITMMFNNKVLKSLIIDDVNYIQTNDKKLFKSILDFSKKRKRIIR